MSLRGQSPGLDRVGEDGDRPVMGLVGAAEGVEEVSEVMAREVSDARRKLAVVEVLDHALDVAAPAAGAREPFTQLCGRAAQEALVPLGRHRVYAPPQRFAAGALEQ